MTTDNIQTSFHHNSVRKHRQKRFIVGIVIILVGLMILGKKLGLFFYGFHIWPVILIAIGVGSGIKHRFSNFGSWALIALGVLFMIPRFSLFGTVSTHFVAPVILILLGIFIMIKPRGKFRRYHYQRMEGFDPVTLDNDTIDVDVTFGERTSTITSKNFKGGTVDSTFGSSKVNLLQADSMTDMILDLKVSFGTIEILVPSHWEVSFEVDNSFASVEDKRYLRTTPTEQPKKLILRGSCSFGSVVVKSI